MLRGGREGARKDTLGFTASIVPFSFSQSSNSGRRFAKEVLGRKKPKLWCRVNPGASQPGRGSLCFSLLMAAQFPIYCILQPSLYTWMPALSVRGLEQMGAALHTCVLLSSSLSELSISTISLHTNSLSQPGISLSCYTSSWFSLLLNQESFIPTLPWSAGETQTWGLYL